MIIKELFIGFAAFAMMVSADLTVSPFDGTWRVDTGTLNLPAKPTIFLLKDNTFKRGDKDAPAVKADGRFHGTASDGYVDEVAVAVLNPRSVRETDRLAGKTVYISTYTVSADGGTLTWRVSDLTKPDGKPTISETVLKRVGKANPTLHSISGEWQTVKINVSTKSYLIWILKLDGNTFRSSSPNGWGYDAIIDGPAVQVRGANEGEMKSVRMPARNIIVQSAVSADGVVGAVTTLEVMPDGKSIKATSRAMRNGAITTFMLYKQ